MERHEVLPKRLAVMDLKARFRSLNPQVGTDVIDWESVAQEGFTFGEQVETFQRVYPMYDWERN